MASIRNYIVKNKVTSHSQKVYMIIAIITAIIFIVIAFLYQKNNENYNNIKQDKESYLIYTKYEDKSTEYIKEIPYVNLKADVFKDVNKDILLFCNNYIEKDKSIITYEYDINGIILSLVIKVITNDSTYAPEPYFRTYNINLSTQEVIADDALLQLFETTPAKVENKIQRGLQGYYSEILKEKYYESAECNYDCFLKWRGIEDYMDYVSYYVRNGKLIAFKSFIAHSIFGEENYFNDEHFEFEIAEAPINIEV